MSAPFSITPRQILLSLGAMATVAAVAACNNDNPSAAPTAPAIYGEAQLTVSGPADVPGARQELVGLVNAIDAAWNAGDATAYAAPYAENVRVITPTGGLLLSRDAVRQLHVFLFANPFAGSVRTTTALDITFLTGTVAVAERTGETTNYRFVPPGITPTAPGVLRVRERLVLEKRSGVWQIIFAQLTQVAPGV